MEAPDFVAGSGWLTEAMGYWPSFHDANLVGVSRENGALRVVVHVFAMTDRVDPAGYFVLEKHHLVTLALNGITVQLALARLFERLPEPAGFPPHRSLHPRRVRIAPGHWRRGCLQRCRGPGRHSMLTGGPSVGHITVRSRGGFAATWLLRQAT